MFNITNRMFHNIAFINSQSQSFSPTLYIHLPNKSYKKTSLPKYSWYSKGSWTQKIRNQNRTTEIELLIPFGNKTDVLYVKEN